MYKVKLNELKYHAYHGLFPQEAKTGNDFVVSLSVELPLELSRKNELGSLVNYVWLKDVVDSFMNKRFELLEDILSGIVEEILSEYPDSHGFVSIKKIQPPFGGRCGSSEVELSY